MISAKPNGAGRLGRLEGCFAVVSLAILAQGRLNVMFAGEGAQTGLSATGAVGVQAIHLVLYAIAAYFVLGDWRITIRVLARERFIAAFIFLALISFIWSIAPLASFRSFIGLAGATVFGLYLGVRYTPRRQLILVSWAVAVLLLLSLATAVLAPGVGKMSGFHAGAWRGVFTHKNAFGRFLVLAMIVVLLMRNLVVERKTWTFLFPVMLVLSVVFLSLSDAKMALAWGVVVLIAGLIAALCQRQFFWAALTALAALWVAAGLVGALHRFVAPAPWEERADLGRPVASVRIDAPTPAVGTEDNGQDKARIPLSFLPEDVATLNGRVPLWVETLRYFKKRPVLGYGYEAFWQVHGNHIAEAWHSAWQVGGAHSGVVELSIGLGLAGLLLFGLSYALAVHHSIRLLLVERSAAGLWPLAYLVFLFTASLTESVVARPKSVYWALYVAVAVGMRHVSGLKRQESSSIVDSGGGS